MTQLTELQAKLVRNIAESEFNGVDGSIPESVEDAHCWLDCVVETPEQKGVYVSLLNKEFVWNTEGDDKVVHLTQAGFDAYKALGPK